MIRPGAQQCFELALRLVEPALLSEELRQSQPWHIGVTKPIAEWERRIDELMARQAASSDAAERKRLFDEVQKIYAEHLPAVYFVAPRVYVASASRVINITPSLIYPRLLSFPDSIAVIH